MTREEIFNTAFGVRTNLANLQPNQCAWGIGDPKDPDFGFCGAIKTKGSYCDAHNDIAYVKKKEKK